MKNIVICCDGTGNSFENVTTESNVIKFYSSLSIDDGQIGYYHPGVGTMGAQDVRWRVAREWSRLKGLAFGAGLLANVGDAYRYLMNAYVDGDQIYLIGFSRGSYTARALASLLHVFGLLYVWNDGLIPYILRTYSQRTRKANHAHRTFHPDEVFQWQFAHSHSVEIHFCGLWDTVSSYGWAYNPIKLPFDGYNPIIRTGRHAVSIHERRCYYRDNLWGAAGPGQNIRQVWFSGVHSDVGGSYDERDSGLSKIALEWMLVEARNAGLRFNSQKVSAVLGRTRPVPKVTGMPYYSQPEPDAMLHHSLHGLWWALEFLPHRYPDLKGRWTIPMGRKRLIPSESLIHELSLRGEYCPKPLPEGFKVEPHVPFA